MRDTSRSVLMNASMPSYDAMMIAGPPRPVVSSLAGVNVASSEPRLDRIPMERVMDMGSERRGLMVHNLLYRQIDFHETGAGTWLSSTFFSGIP